MKKIMLAFSILFVTVVMTGCKCTKGTVSKDTLVSSGWELSAMNGEKVLTSKFPNKLPTITFTTDNKVNGNGGCNGYGGSYTLDADGKLTLGQMMSTKMFCQGVAEDEYMKNLSKADKAKIEEKNLVLYSGNNAVLVFVPKSVE
ncbi:MAG: hypothetical protein DI539_06935 [Flavobacterium psychrophilum]|nr:MAG: hypothetical protein DI539_06935 [Flavobacterium psychrophilum]